MHTLWRDALCAAIRGPLTSQTIQDSVSGLGRHLHVPARKRPNQGGQARIQALALVRS